VDVRVQDGLVVEVGRDLDRPAGVPERAAEGRWLIPGLWDQHVHLVQWAMTSGRLDLSSARSAREALGLVTARLRERPDEPVVGWGHRSLTWPHPPTVAELDLVSGDRPVVLISGDGHHAWLSSAALDAMGLPARDGVVAETEWFGAYPRLAALGGTDDGSPAALDRTMRAAAALGVVGVVDLEFAMPVDGWAARGPAVLRVRGATYPETLEDYLAAGLCTGAVLPGCDPLMTMGPLKIISDGSLNTRTAWCCAPYADEDGSGAANLTPAELRRLLSRADAHGLEVATHAIGDAAVHEALAAYAEVEARGSIEHAQLMTRADVARLAGLGLRASVQPAHLLDDRDVTERCWPDRADRCFMFRSMLDAGVELALGSDAPVSRLDPWLAIAAAVHRSADDRPAWHPEQALTPREALAASVDGVGTVHAGAPADLVLLDADPLDPSGTPAEQASRLRSMPVATTWIAGNLVHDTR
jgi:predicted amidohydrolase YtcJ